MATASQLKVQLKPLADRVVVKKLEAEEKTAGGIVLPDTAKEKPQQGEVLAVGTFKEGKDEGKELPLKKGDRVIYGGYSSDEVEVNGEKYIFVEYKDVLAKLE